MHSEEEIADAAYDLAQQHCCIDKWVHEAHLNGEIGDPVRYRIAVELDGYKPGERSQFESLRPNAQVDLYACAEEAIEWAIKNKIGFSEQGTLDRFRQNYLILQYPTVEKTDDDPLNIPKPERSIWDTLRTSDSRSLKDVMRQITSDSTEDEI